MAIGGAGPRSPIIEQHPGQPKDGKDWRSASAIAEEHRRLGGTFDLAIPDLPNWPHEAALSWQRDRTLDRIADGISADDPACIELAIRYIEWRSMFPGSGYRRARFARRLKHKQLPAEQKLRLYLHFCTLVSGRQYSWEFREYAKLWRIIRHCNTLEKLLIEHRKRARRAYTTPAWSLGESKMESALHHRRNVAELWHR